MTYSFLWTTPSHYTVPCRGLAPTLPLYGPLPRVGPHPPTIQSSAEGRPPPSHYMVPCRGSAPTLPLYSPLPRAIRRAQHERGPQSTLQPCTCTSATVLYLHERLGRPVSNAVWLERVQKTAQEDAISQ